MCYSTLECHDQALTCRKIGTHCEAEKMAGTPSLFARVMVPGKFDMISLRKLMAVFQVLLQLDLEELIL